MIVYEEKTCIIAKFYRTDLVICSLSREWKTHLIAKLIRYTIISSRWIIVGQESVAFAIGAGGGCLNVFSPIYHFSLLSPFF